jgi:uncharacterized protein (DUF2384 family)
MRSASKPKLDSPDDVRRRLLARLRMVFGSEEAVDAWLNHPNALLDDRRPADALRENDFAAVEAALEAFREGVYI